MNNVTNKCLRLSMLHCRLLILEAVEPQPTSLQRLLRPRLQRLLQ